MEKQILVDLVTQAQKGDSNAINQLFTHFYNDIYYFALKTIEDTDTACDITQETFLEVIRSIGNLKEPAAFVTWIRQIAYHQCTRYFKKKKDVLAEEDEDGNTIFDTLADAREGSIPSEVYENTEFRQTIQGIIGQLSEEQRSAILLYYFDELTVGQIASIQGVSEGTVKSRLNYGRKAIKKSVEAYEKKHDIKLHSFSLLPLLLLFFGKEAMPAQQANKVRAAVSQAAGAKAAAVATKTGLFAKIAGLPVVTKIIAGVAAAAIAVGGIAVVMGQKEHDCRDRDDDRRCDICGQTLRSKKPASTKPTEPQPTQLDTEPSEPQIAMPLYRSESLHCYEVSYLVHGNIRNIQCFSYIYIETGDGEIYSPSHLAPLITIDGSNLNCFYDCYVYTDAQGKLVIGRSWREPLYIAEGITGRILYCTIPDVMGLEGAFLYTVEDGKIYRTQIGENGIVAKVPVIFYTEDDTVTDENGNAMEVTVSSFAWVDCISANPLHSSIGFDRLPLLYVTTNDGRLLESSLSYTYGAEDVLQLWATFCDMPSENSKVIGYGMQANEPYCYETPQDTAISCVNEDLTISTFNLPAGYTVANISQIFSGKTLVVVLDNGNIYWAKNEYPERVTDLVLDETLSALNREGHILQIIDGRDAFIFLADDGFIYEKTF